MDSKKKLQKSCKLGTISHIYKLLHTEHLKLALQKEYLTPNVYIREHLKNIVTRIKWVCVTRLAEFWYHNYQFEVKISVFKVTNRMGNVLENKKKTLGKLMWNDIYCRSLYIAIKCKGDCN